MRTKETCRMVLLMIVLANLEIFPVEKQARTARLNLASKGPPLTAPWLARSGRAGTVRPAVQCGSRPVQGCSWRPNLEPLNKS